MTIVSLQTLFVGATGNESSLAVVASPLAIAALFRPLYRRVQRLIDRRFVRHAHDATRIVDVFAVRVQQDTDLDALSRDVVTIVRDALEPESAPLWPDPRR